ncbi:hypothetical protein OPV22_025604 [Ensete ventricosum]|uniref:Ubiquitin-like protein ATG12 n=1 Tax=Ensete ventricosum TaxID=4639 RepID=A0AAV8Q7V2_ENSVE|nr:hypothetical protein OPV22_025604 [Ensete ventricosum]
MFSNVVNFSFDASFPNNQGSSSELFRSSSHMERTTPWWRSTTPTPPAQSKHTPSGGAWLLPHGGIHWGISSIVLLHYVLEGGFDPRGRSRTTLCGEMAAESPTAERKVVVHLRATGDAPILKQAKFKISGSDKFSKVIEFLRRQLHRDTLFVYINSAFSPNPDELVIDLYNSFGFDGKLVVNYASSMAWG